MKHREKILSPLAKHLLVIIIIKVLILYCLWYVLIRPYKVQVDVSQVYNVQSNDSYQHLKESDHDRW